MKPIITSVSKASQLILEDIFLSITIGDSKVRLPSLPKISRNKKCLPTRIGFNPTGHTLETTQQIPPLSELKVDYSLAGKFQPPAAPKLNGDGREP